MAERVRVDEIYEAAFNDEAFDGIASRLAASFGARSALIHWIHEDGATDILSHSAYFTDEQLADYAQNFVAIDPWVDAATRAGQVNSVLNLEELVPVAQFTASDFYNDYVRPMGDDTCRCLGIRLHNEAGSGYIALQRGLAQSAFEASTASQLNEYLPHVRRMLSIRGKLAAAQHSVAEVTALVDTVGLPMFLVDEDLRLRQVNAAGEELLRASEGLQLRNGMLRAEARHGDEQLRHAVARIFARDGGEATAVGIGAPGGGRLSLTIAPARSAHFRAAIVIADARAGAKCGRAQRLRSLFRLSRGEADLAVMLADGLSPTEIAEERGVAIGTVRVQIKQIAAKLGCSRQSEIVSVVASLPPVYPRR